jgi:aspartyl-tRNA(Asn)/glutamyl-tRNA(Gln) amidotransferase subunit B
LEIVSYPDINNPQEAFDYLNYLKLTLQYIDASNCDMEKGSLRCDANISLKKEVDTELGVKVELKNMNTFKGVRDALEYEAVRQRSTLLKGEKILQETRLWDMDRETTEVMRVKEEAHDYRYFPEPDLLDFFVEEGFIDKEKNFVKELPLEKRKRFLKSYALSENEVDILISNFWLSSFFEESCKFFNEPKNISNWLLGPFFEQVNAFPDKFTSVKISPQNFSQIVKYFSSGKLNNLSAKKVLSLSIANNRDIDDIVEKENLTQVSGEEELLVFVEEAINDNPKAIKEYLEGKEQAIMFFVGQVMKKTKGKANPKVVKEMLRRRLEK